MGDSESRNRESPERVEGKTLFPTATVAPIWLEGPYGNLNSLDYYQTLLLVAGGSGCSFTLPLMLDYVRRARSMYLGNTEVAVAIERLTFVWVIREEGTYWNNKGYFRFIILVVSSTNRMDSEGANRGFRTGTPEFPSDPHLHNFEILRSTNRIRSRLSRVPSSQRAKRR